LKKRYSIPISIFGVMAVLFGLAVIGSTVQTDNDSNNQVSTSADITEIKKTTPSQTTFYNPLYNCALGYDGLTRISTSHPELRQDDGIRLIEYQIKMLEKKIAFAESKCHERIDEWYFDSINIQQLPIDRLPEVKELFEIFDINANKEKLVEYQKQYAEYLEIYKVIKEQKKQEILEQLKNLKD